ncbi:hypothetical protein [Haloarchaeobius iranensis]|uniref:Uncharacterized protein n=1 Tax=Haloarchaeobius iranensis TaxID=996166 RepID=A0A1G9UV62_9EURY|nr:hypothetical protein [Haloarchaeobius iranensis]SDM63798.1 hypothetical protein SAMN05192554_10524 [Haloarchaeobius iranensis]
MSDETHGIDIEEDTELETADDAAGAEREAAAAEANEQENPHNHRDEEPFQS